MEAHRLERAPRKARGARTGILALWILACPAWAQYSVSQFPMLINAPPPSNILLTVDDSGSMAWAYIPDLVGSYDASAGYASSAYNGAYYNPCSLYPNAVDSAGNQVPTGFTNASSGTGYPLTTFNAAYYDGFQPEGGSIDLSNYVPTKQMSYSASPTNPVNVTPISASNQTFKAGPAYYYIPVPPAGSSYTYSCTPGTPAGSIAFPTSSAPGAWLASSTGACVAPGTTGAPPPDACFTKIQVDGSHGIGPAGADERQNFANWFSFYRTRHLSIVSAASIAMQDPSLQNERVAWQALNTCADFTGSHCQGARGDYFDNRISQFTNGHRNDFYNWLFQIPANKYTPTRQAWWRAGQYFSNSALGGNSPYGINPNPGLSAASGMTVTTSSTELQCVNNFNVTLTDGLWNTKNETQSNFCGINGNIGACGNADNAATTFPDTVAYAPATASTQIYGDGANGADATVNNGSLADIAFYYWSTNLRPDLTGFYVAPYIADTGTANPWTGASPDTAWPYWNPANDPATWPHLVNFTVGVGLTGFLSMPGITWSGNALAGTAYQNLYQASPACLPADASIASPTPAGGSCPSAPVSEITAPQTSACVWPQVTPCASGGGYTGGYVGAGNVYDLWHAAINSRGDAYSAESPTDLVNSLAAIFTRVEGQTIGNSAAAASSASLSTTTTSTQLYVASYDAQDWHGTITAYSLAASTGAVSSTPAWTTTAASLLGPSGTGFASRKVFTTATPLPGGSATQSLVATIGIPFNYSSLNAAGSISMLAFGDSPTTQAAVVDYLLGDASNEVRNGGYFRNRSVTPLGDIVDSSPMYSSTSADYGYSVLQPEGGSYAAYLAARSSSGQPNVLYAGANDGMLHAFDVSSSANSTSELFAYVPHAVLARLGKEAVTQTGLPPTVSGLPNPKYLHAFSVDGPVTVGDAYFGAGGASPSWHSVVVGTTGAGGPGVFALDVTNPSTFSAANVLWDLDGAATTTADPNLGDTIGQATIARLNNGDWVAVFGNGYLSARGCAVLYLVRLSDGLVRTYDTSGAAAGATTPCTGSKGSNGLGTPSLLDLDQNGTADYVFAGDLQGNLWKFDLSSTNPAQWGVAYSAGATPLPLFTAMTAAGTPQPIVVAPNLGPAPGAVNSYIVYAVTGHMFAVGDAADTTTQSVYAVIDSGSAIGTARASLVQQVLTGVAGAGTASGLSDEDVTSTVQPSGNNPVNGWFVDLANAGERALTMPNLIGGMILFSTVVPSAQPCAGACQGSLVYALNQFSGAGGLGFLKDLSTGATYDAIATTVGCVKGLTLVNNGATLNVYASGDGSYGGAGAGGAAANPISVKGGVPSVNTQAGQNAGTSSDINQITNQLSPPGRISWHSGS